MTDITITLTPDEFQTIHAALMQLPMGRVEQLVIKLRKAAASAIQATRGETKQETAQS